MPLCRCILLKFYIKPQLVSSLFVLGAGCILLKFYIKPQLRLERELAYCVVSYRNSTSNHNLYPVRIDFIKLYLIEILHQTTTRRGEGYTLVLLYLIEILHQTTTESSDCFCICSLYLIEILHQTTTRSPMVDGPVRCILSKFYIKPQRVTPDYLNYQGCILSKFYIKPQLFGLLGYRPKVVSYRNSTSNHNLRTSIPCSMDVVSYRNSTSNHNAPAAVLGSSGLYLIEILHQTTTSGSQNRPCPRLYLIEILHQTTTSKNSIQKSGSCILSKFYIKPQRRIAESYVFVVVSYRNSTSNHNASHSALFLRSVVSYRNSTSNHNSVLHSFSNLSLYLIEILHQTTTYSDG